ncbi:penicillin acylase family protein [Govanella unica]|uniref:Penicillin acylase family protein n=1 Tax=Govanella unica TaxID=2975056 RepID=A0A9X3TYZ9_9PROT|nr:penicillin acylase family protein [Govania unica]MDA5194228.1 penicillin acylase family protein [Govania unica]
MAVRFLGKLLSWLALGAFLITPELITEARADVEILRDRQGVPHVYGDTEYEVFVGFGYIMSQDRLFQMEMRKRQALGKTAEVLGKGDKAWPDKYLSKDIDARTMHDPKALNIEYSNLPFADKMLINGFTDGVNKTITEVLKNQSEKLPKPFKDYGFLPELWTVSDTMIYAVDVLGAYSSFSTQILNMELYHFLRQKYPKDCDDIFNQLLWKTDVNAPTTKRDHQKGGKDKSSTQPLGCQEQAPNGLDMASKPTLLGGMDKIMARESSPKRASMAWLVGRDKAAGFSSIFVNGPQPGWHTPSYYYPVGLHGGAFDLVGFAAEGSMVLEVGVNPSMSWGITAGLGNHVDHFQEHLEKPGSTRYRLNNEWHDMMGRAELIEIKGEDPLKMVIRSTVHGPVVAGDKSSSIAYSQAISWQGAGVSSVMAWVNAGKTRNFKDWLAEARSFAFGYNWFYADKDGQVGSVFTGRFVKHRNDQDIRLPATGTGGYEWQEFLPANANPAVLTTGYIVNFNNKPAKDWPNSGLYWEQWAEANQVDILLGEITKKERLTWNDMWDINHVISYRDVSASYFVPYILRALENAEVGSDLAKARALIAKWNQMRTDDDGDGKFDTAGQALFDAWLPVMVRDTLAPTLDGFASAPIWLAAGYQTKAPRLEEHPSAGTLVTYHALLSSDGRSGVHHYYNFFGDRGPDEVIRSAMNKAIENLKKTQSGDMSKWRIPAVPQVFFDSNANRIPMTGKDKLLTLPLYANRGAMNLMSGYGLEDKGVMAGFVLPPGQSGFIPPEGKWQDNPLFANHMQMYRDYGLRPLWLSREQIEKNLGAEPISFAVDLSFKHKL